MIKRNTEHIATPPRQQAKVRNQSIECFRLLSAIMVVFLHYKFPGVLGDIMDCLGRFAVPFFFIVSGYFAYQADAETIGKRIKNTAKLNIYATVFYLLWGSCREKYFYDRGRLGWLLEKLSLEKLSDWLFLCINPFSAHLWYLTAIFVCYCLIYLYVLWQDDHHNYNTLYIISFFLYMVHIAMSFYIAVVGYGVACELYRNALFFGLPMFGLGIFIREHRERIMETYQLSGRKLIVILLAGMVCSLLQWFGMGAVEMPVGTLIEVIAIMLLLCSMPNISQKYSYCSTIISKLGELSLNIYITHPFWIDIYNHVIEERLSVLGKSAAGYFSPIFVVLLSAFAGIIWILIKAFFHNAISNHK